MTTQYKVQAPDGTVHLIEGPDNASPADIEAFAAKTIPKAAPTAPQYDPSTGGSTLNLAGFDTGIPTSQGVDRFLSGAGSAVNSIINGGRQIYAKAADAISPLTPTMSSLVTGQQPTRAAAVQADVDSARQTDAPLLNTGAGMAGNVAGNVAATMLPLGVVAKAAPLIGLTRTGAVAGALLNPASATTALGTASAAVGGGALNGFIQPTATGESRTVNTGVGAVGGSLGQGVASTLGRIAQPVQSGIIDPIRQKAVQVLQDAGVPLNLAQLTGSPFVQRITSGLSDNIFTAGKQADYQAAQKGAYNNALLNLIGESGTAATPDVMGGALGRTNNVFRSILSNNDVPLTPSLAQGLGDAQAMAVENAKTPVVNIVNRAFDSVDPATGAIPGQTAYNLVKDMRSMRNSAGQDTTLAHIAGNARSAMLDGVNDALSPTDQAAFAEARRQQAIMHTLEGAIDPTTGDISAPKLGNIMAQKANRATSLYGQGDQSLNDLAQAGRLVTDRTPNSGTVQRMIGAAAPGLAVGGLGGLYDLYNNPDDFGGALGTAGKFAAAGIAFPKLAQMAINNPTTADYLANGVGNNTLRGLLQAPSSTFGNAAVRSAPTTLFQNQLLKLVQDHLGTAPTMVIRASPAQ